MRAVCCYDASKLSYKFKFGNTLATVFSNLSVYLAVAEEALADSHRQFNVARAPKPDAQPGYIIEYDPQQRSFKNSLIAIAFAGIYLEALLGVIGNASLGKELYNKLDRQTTYEEKLRLLGIADSQLLNNCKRFREARNDLIHEKSIDISFLNVSKIRMAQEEAEFAVALILEVRKKFEAAL